MIMEKLFVPYELAAKLKEKGFNEPCLACYTENAYGSKSKKIQYFREPNEDINEDFVFIAAPLYQQVVDWFVEKHKIFVRPDFLNGDFLYIIYDLSKGEKKSLMHMESINVAIQEALKLI